jgi:hypothetical protein
MSLEVSSNHWLELDSTEWVCWSWQFAEAHVALQGLVNWGQV